MFIPSSLLGLLLLSSAPLATLATIGPTAVQHQWALSDDRGRDRVVAGRRIIHFSEKSGFVNDRALQTDGERTQYPKASVAGLRSGASRSTSNREIDNNYAAYTKNSYQRNSTDDRLQRKPIGSYDSNSSNSSTKLIQSIRTRGQYSRTSRNFQNAMQPPGGSLPDPDSRFLLAPDHGHNSPTPLDLPRTSFSCQGRDHGYYADTEADCQVFHVCGPEGGQHSFACPSGTVFNQQVLVCDWWFKFECSRAPQLYKKGNQKPEDDLNNRNTLSEFSHVFGINNEGIEPSAATGVTANNPSMGMSDGDFGQQTPYGRAARRLEGGTSSRGGAHGNVIQGNMIPSNVLQPNVIQSPSGSETTEFTNEQNRNSNFASSPHDNSSQGSILLFSELGGIVSDVGVDSDGEILFISDDIINDNSLAIDTLSSRETSGAIQQNREQFGDAQRSSGTSMFHERGISGFVPSYAFPLMVKNSDLFSVSPVP